MDLFIIRLLLNPHLVKELRIKAVLLSSYEPTITRERDELERSPDDRLIIVGRAATGGGYGFRVTCLRFVTLRRKEELPPWLRQRR
ncbi:hypothetical protein L1987_80412 [Smallanthus sonchifolius]|uniref:Uncharacterized protein n=1 Tax=Smallanthus sonchifolius TaxID=185202 RepID=A0ACB8YMS3_9ASTR|nr:hypothetical protein L1987_80412 [Smallanthus sonchifolius]